MDEALRSSSLFRRIGPDDRHRLAGVAHLRTYGRGDVVFRESDASDAFYTVVSGRVKIFKVLASGKEVILEIFGPGDPLGAIAAYEGRPFPASALALEETSCLLLPRGAFFALLEQHTSLVRGQLSGMSQRLPSSPRRRGHEREADHKAAQTPPAARRRSARRQAAPSRARSR